MRIFTDASTSGKISGIAFVITDNKHSVLLEKAKAVEITDNNTAELSAIYYALNSITSTNEHITILSDSQYALDAINRNRYRKHERELVLAIRKKLASLHYATMWIKGHNTDQNNMLSFFNRRADTLAGTSRKKALLTNAKEEYRKRAKQYKIRASQQKPKQQKFSDGMQEYMEIIRSIYR